MACMGCICSSEGAVIDSDDVVMNLNFEFGVAVQGVLTTMTIAQPQNSQERMDPAHDLPLGTEQAESET